MYLVGIQSGIRRTLLDCAKALFSEDVIDRGKSNGHSLRPLLIYRVVINGVAIGHYFVLKDMEWIYDI